MFYCFFPAPCVFCFNKKVTPVCFHLYDVTVIRLSPRLSVMLAKKCHVSLRATALSTSWTRSARVAYETLAAQNMVLVLLLTMKKQAMVWHAPEQCLVVVTLVGVEEHAHTHTHRQQAARAEH